MSETNDPPVLKRGPNRSAWLIGVAMLIAIVGMLRGPWQEQAAPPSSISSSVASANKASSPLVDATHSSPMHRTNPWGRDPHAAAVAKTRDAFDQSTDLRAFFDHALTNPAGGGLYYAKKVFLQCLTMKIDRNAPKADALQTGSQEQFDASTAALDRQVARCNGLDSRSQAELGAAIKRSVSDDPIEGLIDGERRSREVGKQMSFDAAAAMVQRATDLGDPYFLREAMLYLNNAARRFDDVVLDDGGRHALTMATVLMPCDLGVDCGNGADTAGFCYRNGQCAGMFQRIAGVYELPTGGGQSLVEAEAELVNAAREGTLLSRYGK